MAVPSARSRKNVSNARKRASLVRSPIQTCSSFSAWISGFPTAPSKTWTALAVRPRLLVRNSSATILMLSLTALNRFEAMKRESSSTKASVEAWCRRMAAASFWHPSALVRRLASAGRRMEKQPARCKAGQRPSLATTRRSIGSEPSTFDRAAIRS